MFSVTGLKSDGDNFQIYKISAFGDILYQDNDKYKDRILYTLDSNGSATPYIYNFTAEQAKQLDHRFTIKLAGALDGYNTTSFNNNSMVITSTLNPVGEYLIA